MTIIFETGSAPEPKARYRVQVLSHSGRWREIENHASREQAELGATFQANRRHTKARVIDTQALAEGTNA